MRSVFKVQSWSWSDLFATRRRGPSTDRPTVADRLLALRVATALEKLEWPSVESVSIYIRDGLVSLFGLVCSEADRAFVIEVVERVQGVKAVCSNLQLIDSGEINEDLLAG